jgi:hypothetical protein
VTCQQDKAAGRTVPNVVTESAFHRHPYRWSTEEDTSMTATLQRICGRSLVSKELFDRLIRHIIADEDVEERLAERMVDQALAFLYACAKTTDTPLRPSKTVDVGWHAFVLHTSAYAEFCDRIAGRFIHHEPTEFEPPAHVGTTLAPTVNTMRLLGLAVDDELWMRGSADCSQCHSGCTNCGQGGKGGPR